MRFLMQEKLSEHKYKDNNGYLICTDAILSRTGNQTYRANEVFADGDDSEISVNRPYEEVFNTKTLSSFENCPLCKDHPDCDVNPGNHKDLAVGFVRNIRQSKQDGYDVMIGDLVITDQEIIDLIESGEYTDLSCGYDADIIKDDNGYHQSNIRGNHVALCQCGRAGIARIVDSKKVKDGVWKYRLMLRSDYLKKNWKYVDGEDSWDAIVYNFNSWKRQGYDVVIIEEDTKKLMKDSVKDKASVYELLGPLMKYGVKIKEVPGGYVVTYEKYLTGQSILNVMEKYGYKISSREPGKIVIFDSVKDAAYPQHSGKFEVQNAADGYEHMGYFNTREEAKKWIQESYKFEEEETGERFSKYVIVAVKDSVKDDSYDWFVALDNNDIPYTFIKGGYGIKFKSYSNYVKAKALAKKYSVGISEWDDNEYVAYDYHSTRISNEHDSAIEGRTNPSEAKCNCDHPFHECGPNCECGCKDDTKKEIDMKDANIGREAVRSLCIKNDWYTRGDTDAYSNLLNNVDKWSLEQIAQDIMDHSRPEFGMYDKILKELRKYSWSDSKVKDLDYDMNVAKDIKEKLLEGANADLPNNIRKVITSHNGNVKRMNVTPNKIEVDYTINGWTGYNSIYIGSSFNQSINMLAEDIAHLVKKGMKDSYGIYTVKDGKEVKIGSYIGDSASNVLDEFTEDHPEYKTKALIIKKKDSINNVSRIVKIINKVRR